MVVVIIYFVVSCLLVKTTYQLLLQYAIVCFIFFIIIKTIRPYSQIRTVLGTGIRASTFECYLVLLIFSITFNRKIQLFSFKLSIISRRSTFMRVRCRSVIHTYIYLKLCGHRGRHDLFVLSELNLMRTHYNVAVSAAVNGQTVRKPSQCLQNVIY